jgi:ABC-type phosphate transport system substrate-binding protein
MRKLNLAFMATAAVVGSLGVAGSAHAQVEVYGGGASFPALVYRDLFDCAGTPVTGPRPADCTAPGFVNAKIFYGSAGSGAGKRAWRNHDGSSAATGLGTGVSGSPVNTPYSFTLPATGFPSFHYAGSDDVLTASDVSTYNSTQAALRGAAIQIPAIIGPVTLAFNPGPNVTFTGPNFDGPYSVTPPGTRTVKNFNLTRQAMCGIFSGHITKWNNPILAALGVVDSGAGGTPIQVVRRRDGSGTTFLLTQALKAQCDDPAIQGPMSESSSVTVLYRFPWTDRNIGTGLCAPTGNGQLPIQGSNLVNWPNFTNDQCGTAISNPGGATFITPPTDGSGAMRDMIKSTPGSIGYVSADYSKPFSTHANANDIANVQNQYALDIGSSTFIAATPVTAASAMASAPPVFTTAQALQSPLSWSRQGVVGNPDATDAYPLSGFSWLDLYQCYAPASGVSQALLDTAGGSGYLFFHYGAQSAPMMAVRGFAQVPNEWVIWVGALLSNASIGTPLGDPTACAGKPGA